MVRLSDSTSFLQLRLDVREPAHVAGFRHSRVLGSASLRRIGAATLGAARNIAVSLVTAAREKCEATSGTYSPD